MNDVYGRNIDYIRISITDRCNLRCVYCMPEEGVSLVSHEQILTYDEILRLCRILVTIGIKKVKLTGGEPLVRRNLSGLISDMKKIPGLEQITLTTNGILLGTQIQSLIEAGLDGINISLDTLDPKHYALITRGGDVEKVLGGIEKALNYPQISVKVNCVPNHISEQEILDLVDLARNKKIHVRFIELMPVGLGKEMLDWSDRTAYQDQEQRIRDILEYNFGEMNIYSKQLGNGPSHYYSLEGFQGKIGFISAISHKFCDKCNRVRLTSEGLLKTCLQYESGVNLMELLRSQDTDNTIREKIVEAIYHKQKEHEFLGNAESKESKSMFQIGG